MLAQAMSSGSETCSSMERDQTVATEASRSPTASAGSRPSQYFAQTEVFAAGAAVAGLAYAGPATAAAKATAGAMIAASDVRIRFLTRTVHPTTVGKAGHRPANGMKGRPRCP